MNMKTRLIALSVSACLVSMPTSAGIDMKDIFGEYATSGSSGGAYDTSQGRYFYGGSFTARTKLVNADFVKFSPPSIKQGCSGIDIFSGSFGLISGDELVQVARGVAQGTASYFFNLAISSICSSCAQTMQTISKKVEEFNRWGKNSCENTMAALERSTSLNSKVANLAKSKGALLDTQAGKINTWIESNINIPAPPGTCADGLSCDSAKKVIEGNVIYNNIKSTYSTVTLSAGNLNTLKVQELIMSLFGTVIISTDSTGCPAKRAAGEECVAIEIIEPTLTVDELINGKSDGAQASFIKCDTETACLNPTVVDEPLFVGLSEYYQSLLLGSDGIFRKINSKRNLDSAQVQLISSYQFPYVKSAISFKGAAISDLGKYYANSIASGQVEGMMDEFLRLVSISRWATNDGKGGSYKEQLDMIVKEARSSKDTAMKALMNEQDSIYKTLGVLLAKKKLQERESA